MPLLIHRLFLSTKCFTADCFRCIVPLIIGDNRHDAYTKTMDKLEIVIKSPAVSTLLPKLVRLDINLMSETTSKMVLQGPGLARLLQSLSYRKNNQLLLAGRPGFHTNIRLCHGPTFTVPDQKGGYLGCYSHHG